MLIENEICCQSYSFIWFDKRIISIFIIYVNIIDMHWKNFLYFSPAEKIAVLILVVVIVLTFILNVSLSKSNKSDISIPQNDSLIAAFERLHEELVDRKEESKNFNYKSNTKSDYTTSRKVENNLTKENQPKSYSEKPTYIKQEKFTEAGSINLNETDTAQWKKVPGVGSAYSARIVKYRDKLGGYISINLLKEVYGVTDEVFDDIVPFISEDDIDIEGCIKLNINKLEFKEILAHPYIDFEQTKAIVNLRRRTGAIASINELAMLEEFTSEDIEKITPYIDF